MKLKMDNGNDFHTYLFYNHTMFFFLPFIRPRSTKVLTEYFLSAYLKNKFVYKINFSFVWSFTLVDKKERKSAFVIKESVKINY